MEDPQRRELTQSMHRSAGSFELVMSPLLLGLIGLWVDSRLDTSPFVTVIFCLIGLSGAAVKIYYGYDHEMESHNEGMPWAK